ncbi:MAG: hypothetical protein A2W93_07825 [Bacteroidetes bacterium GWF2_43_63]|nr:MAG: hypothetical protein A2W94_09680 [Bacteroidetes bacterium GWE2_42_42]OFY53077.1 MAG: hypothetical protein A2W93_07825 [Bacteroidetes bacterium GWF2_43_63]HBG69159.1 hypothetical protein [Bacteroidales bacterium]HCB62570.1 hypothetical protein [Bacteroidales bacterium]
MKIIYIIRKYIHIGFAITFFMLTIFHYFFDRNSAIINIVFFVLLFIEFVLLLLFLIKTIK